MYKALYALSVLLIATCNSSEKKQETATQDTAVVNRDTVVPVTYSPPQNNYEEEHAIEVGDSTLVIGNFDGDNIPDSGYLVVLDKDVTKYDPKDFEEGEDDHSDPVIYRYTFRFRNERLSTLPDLIGGAVSLVNEGDINHDGVDEISVLSQYLVVTMGTLYTYTYQNGKWKQIGEMGSGSYPNPLSKDEVENLVRMKDSIPYFYEHDNSTGQKLELKDNDH